MGKTIRVEVTAEDIAKGERRVAWRCPIALACGRVFGEPIIGRDGCNLTVEGRRLTDVELPAVAKRFTLDFDECRPVEPFAFDLELP